MIWLALALAGAVGALLVGMIGFGTSLVVLPTLALLFPTLFAADTGKNLADCTRFSPTRKMRSRHDYFKELG